MPLSVLGAEAAKAGINFVADLGTSAVGGLFGANQARKNRAFQERMYKQQVQDTIDFWKMQNEYNLPSAVYARELQGLRDNNLNPYLMYSNGVPTGNLAPQPQLPSAPHGSQGNASGFNAKLDFANLALIEAQADVLKSEAERNRTESSRIATETEILDFDLAYKKDTREIKIAQESAQYDLTKSMEALNREQRYYYRDQCKVLSAQVESIVSDMENKKAMTAAEIKDINTRLDKYLEQFPHLIANLDSQTRKNYADALVSSVTARYQQKLIDSGYIDILTGKEGQDLLNAIKYGTQLDIENGLKALEFQSRPKPDFRRVNNIEVKLKITTFNLLYNSNLKMSYVFIFVNTGKRKGINKLNFR